MDAAMQHVLSLAWRNPNVRHVVGVVAELGLPQGALASGAVFQSVWNALCDRPSTAGIADYDVFYFDPDDLSQSREDTVAQQVQQRCPGICVDVSNQARVHTWYPEYFGHPYPPLTHGLEGLNRFLATACAVAIRLGCNGSPHLIAPFGVDDLLAMRLRPTPDAIGAAHYAAKALRWSKQWPLTVTPWPEDRP